MMFVHEVEESGSVNIKNETDPAFGLVSSSFVSITIKNNAPPEVLVKRLKAMVDEVAVAMKEHPEALANEPETAKRP